MPATNPCQSCGACCAFFKVVFDQNETDANCSGGVPIQYTLAVDPVRRAMRGTETRSKRCAALEGMVGRGVNCAIYNRRPSCCRNFRGGWEKDIVNPICNRARAVYGLPPFDSY